MSFPKEAGLLEPLRIAAFRNFWLAGAISNVGTIMQSMGAAWLMTTLSGSSTMVGLVQTAATSPVFLLGLFSGALADIVDKRKSLLSTMGFMLGVATTLGILTTLGWMTPWKLLGMTFLIGIGGALTLPVWQTAVIDLVPRTLIPSAVSLNSMSFNLARTVAPGLGGLAIAFWGTASVFFLNAASFFAVMLPLARWPEGVPTRRDTSESMADAIRAGLRFVLSDQVVRSPMIRSFCFVLCGSSVWAVLPLVARDRLEMDAAGYGGLLTAFGVGSLLAGGLLPMLRSKVSTDRLVGGSILLFGASEIWIALSRHPWVVGGGCVLAGFAWIGTLVNYNVAVRMAAPAWLQGRALACYMLLFQGGLAAGGALWGWIAGRTGIEGALLIAAGGSLAGLILIRYFPLIERQERPEEESPPRGSEP